MMTWFTPCSWAPEGGYYWEFLVGVLRPVLWIPTLFQIKKCHFPHQFSDQISKIHTHFRTWPNLACSRLGSQIIVPSFLSFYFRVRAFSIQRTQLSVGAWNRLDLIRQKLCHDYQVTKKFCKCVSNSHISISFLFIWNWNDKYVPCTLP